MELIIIILLKNENNEVDSYNTNNPSSEFFEQTVFSLKNNRKNQIFFSNISKHIYIVNNIIFLIIYIKLKKKKDIFKSLEPSSKT